MLKLNNLNDCRTLRYFKMRQCTQKLKTQLKNKGTAIFKTLKPYTMAVF